MQFYSKHRKLVIAINDKVIKFTPFGAGGSYNTEDEEVIELLKNHHLYNSNGYGSFTAHVIGDKKSNIIKGQRGSRGEDVEDIKSNFKEYDTLKSEIIKVDGSFRKDADEDKIIRFNELKEKLGL